MGNGRDDTMRPLSSPSNPAPARALPPLIMNIQDALNALRAGTLDEAGQHSLIEQALANGQTDLAYEAADHLAYALLSAGRAEEAAAVAQQALAAGQDFALLHTLALAEHALGKPAGAIGHLEQALKQLGTPQDDDLVVLRADILEHLGTLCREQGKALRAWQVLEQACEVHQQLGDITARLRCESALAHLAREMGDNTQSADKWLNVLEMAKHANLPEETARALLELAEVAKAEGQPEAESALRQEAIEALAEAELWPELARTLFQIARTQSRRDAAWQSLWVMLNHGGPMDGLMNVQAWLFMREDQKSMPEAAKVAAAVLAAIEDLPSELPRHAENHRMSITHLMTCARLQGIHETEIKAWMKEKNLRLEDGIIPSVLKLIEDQDETGEWMFNREKLDMINRPE